MRKFANRYPTYEEWGSHAGNSEYARRIRRLHFLYPSATLAQLSGRPAKGEKPLSQMRRKALSQLAPLALTPRERRQRLEALEVVSRMRNRHEPLSKAIENARISKKGVLKHAGGALRRAKGDHYAKPFDAIPRAMKVNVNGLEVIVVVDSKNASVIGAYHNAKKKFLDTGDTSVLAAFAHVTIKDMDGIIYRPDTEPAKILAVEEGREEPEPYPIYSL